jgi:hypothetical protein
MNLSPALILVAVDPADIMYSHIIRHKLAELIEIALKKEWPKCIVNVIKADAPGGGFVSVYDMDISGLMVRTDYKTFRRVRQIVDQTWESYDDEARPE